MSLRDIQVREAVAGPVLARPCLVWWPLRALVPSALLRAIVRCPEIHFDSAAQPQRTSQPTTSRYAFVSSPTLQPAAPTRTLQRMCDDAFSRSGSTNGSSIAEVLPLEPPRAQEMAAANLESHRGACRNKCSIAPPLLCHLLQECGRTVGARRRRRADERCKGPCLTLGGFARRGNCRFPKCSQQCGGNQSPVGAFLFEHTFRTGLQLFF